MKRILAAVLALLTLLSLSSCKNKPFKKGEILENGYKSEYFGIEVSLGDDWNIFSGEEIDEYNKEQSVLMFDFVAVSKKGTNLHINYYEKVKKSAKKLSKDQLTSISSSFESAGFEVTTAKTGKIKVAGKRHHTAYVVGENDGLWYSQRIVFVEKDGYIAYINITGVDSEEIEETLKSINKLK